MSLFNDSAVCIPSIFPVLGRAAEENRLPLVGGFLRSVELGASAAVGFDFYEMGYKTGQLAVRVKNGESPARIPIQVMTDVKIHLNLEAAAKQGLILPKSVLEGAAKITRASSGGAPGK